MFNLIKRNENTKISSKEEFDSITNDLKIIFFWPKDGNPDSITKIFHLKLAVFNFITVVIPASFTFSHAYHYRSKINSYMVFDLVVTLVFLCFILIEAITQTNLKEFVKMINQMSSASTGPEQAPYNNFTIDFKKLSKISRYIVLSLITTSVLFGLWKTSNCESKKAKNRSFESCGLIFNAHFPFDYDFFPLKQFVLLWQYVCLFVMGITFTSLCMLVIAYIDKTVASVNYLIDLVGHFNTTVDDDMEVKKNLRNIINIHQVIVSERQQINKQCRLGHMIRGLLGRLVMALSIFDILENGNAESLLLAGIWLIVMGILEMAGQKIIDKGQELEKVLYNTKWYKMRNREDRKSFILLYLMVQQPLSLYSGPFLQLSNAALMEIFKSTYSATATLLKMVK